MRLELSNLMVNLYFSKNICKKIISALFHKMKSRVTWSARIFRKIPEINKFPCNF
jgi:hypothetical protein